MSDPGYEELFQKIISLEFQNTFDIIKTVNICYSRWLRGPFV